MSLRGRRSGRGNLSAVSRLLRRFASRNDSPKNVNDVFGGGMDCRAACHACGSQLRLTAMTMGKRGWIAAAAAAGQIAALRSQ
jgi:hypothetical protein